MTWRVIACNHVMKDSIMVTRERKLAKNKMLWQIIIDRKLHHAFKVECVKQGTSMSAKASELIAKYVGYQSMRT